MPTYFGTCNALGVTDFTDVDDSAGWPSFAIYTGKSFVCPGTGLQAVSELASILGIFSGTPSVVLALYDSIGNLVCQGTGPVLVVDGYVWQGHMSAAMLSPNPAYVTGGQSYRIGVSVSGGVLDTYNNTGHVLGDTDFGATDFTTGWPGTIPSGTDYDGWITSVRCGVTPQIPPLQRGRTSSYMGSRMGLR